MGSGFYVSEWVSDSVDVFITVKKIVSEISKDDAKELILKLLEKYPSLFKQRALSNLDSKEIRELLNQYHLKQNKQLTEYLKT
jgi:hypothetical protein